MRLLCDEPTAVSILRVFRRRVSEPLFGSPARRRFLFRPIRLRWFQQAKALDGRALRVLQPAGAEAGQARRQLEAAHSGFGVGARSVGSAPCGAAEGCLMAGGFVSAVGGVFRSVGSASKGEIAATAAVPVSSRAHSVTWVLKVFFKIHLATAPTPGSRASACLQSRRWRRPATARQTGPRTGKAFRLQDRRAAFAGQADRPRNSPSR
jgi:hypothetical protein